MTSAIQDYSQNGEQAAILHALRDQKPGRFLDIGAWHAKQLSNTRALYELGWSGVMIEPSPGPMAGLVAEYGNDPRITLIQAAVVVHPTVLVPMYITDDAVSTMVEGEYEVWKDAAKFHGKVHVPGITLEQIANQFGGFSFVNIDAEGISARIFTRMMELGQFPKCVCIEVDKDMHHLMAYATANHYVGTFSNGTNLVVSR